MVRRLFARRSRRVLLVLAAVSAVGAGTAVVTSAIATTPPHAPRGSFDSLTQSAIGFQIRGWAFDPDTTAAVSVAVTVNGHVTRNIVANGYRPDVARAFGVQSNTGFGRDYQVSAGTYKICVTALNLGAGTTNTSLGCRSITVDHDPRGAIISTTQFPGGFTATGWAYDPNQPTTPIQVAISVDGTHTALVTANQTRTDIPAQQPPSGNVHGFTIKALATEGTHRVCIYAKNLGVGADATTGCVNVTTNYSPIGAIQTLRQVPGGVGVAGWATDPDTSTGIVTVKIYSDGTQIGSMAANQSGSAKPGHGWGGNFMLPGTSLPPGTHNICITGVNLGTYGEDRQFACKSVAVNYNPTAAVLTLKQSSPGIAVTGWASDPDTSDPISVAVQADGKTVTTVTANQSGSTHSGHNFSAKATLPNGKHNICAIGINVKYGSANSPGACQTITLNFNPVGAFDSLTRATNSTNLVVKGWAFDPDAPSATITLGISIDGISQTTKVQTGVARPDIVTKYPGTGPNQGFSATYQANDGEHRVCMTAGNLLGGSGNTSLGCKIINAVHPKPPSAPQSVTAIAGYGGATVSWAAPASDGGAPWTSYRVTASPGGASITVGANATTGTITGLASKATYTFTVVAINVAGTSAGATSAAVTTQASPPPQTTPAPISTSRYIRNISSATSTDLATMKAEGAADAAANPSGHGYLILLDIGGQDETDGGVLLSATTHFVSYANLVKDINSYVDGYHSAQKASAPIIIALGTNNDVDVSTTAGVNWAKQVVNPVRSYASKYTGITIAGANDIEPGFRGTYTQTKAWLSGYLSSTLAPFVNNGSADGCSWTQTNYGCNNGWTMSGLYYLSAGAAPVRIINLPQIYNNTMAAQWKYISLTGVQQKQPRINFGGALTEWTACQQAGGCGSLTGNSAWTQLWNQLQSDAALKVGSLPYSTDLRIDR